MKESASPAVLTQQLHTARRRFWRRMAAATGAVMAATVMAAAAYFTRVAEFRIAPEAAAAAARVTVTDGIGLVFFAAAYVVGRRAELSFAADGFVSQTLAVDFAYDHFPLRVDLRAAPGQVVMVAEPADAATRWRVDGEYVASGAEVSITLPPGVARMVAEHDFYQPQAVTLEVRGGQTITRKMALALVIGELNIASQPSAARVFIDGEERGATPLRVAVAGGRHGVRLELDGYENLADEVAVTYRKPRPRRDYHLIPRPAVARISASPGGGVVRVDGVAVAVQWSGGFANLALTAGKTQLVSYEKAGYATQSRQMLARPAAPATANFALDAEFGEVTIRSVPAAQITINGGARGATPQTFRLSTIAHVITLAREGYRSIKVSATPTAATPLLIEHALRDELGARLTESPPLITAAGGVEMRRFDPRGTGGEFVMGAPSHEKSARANEFQRRVKLTKPFYVGVHEITEAQFAQYLAAGSAAGSGANSAADSSQNRSAQAAASGNLPARGMSWRAAAGFANWMSAQHGLAPAYDFAAADGRDFDATADGYRLLSEAEWEWLARRAGRAAAARFVWGNAQTIPANSGNFADESARGSAPKYIPQYHDGFAGVAPVASFAARVGLYDLAGNVSEWVHDGYDLRPPRPGVVYVDPFGAAGDYGQRGRVIKGASFRTASLTGLRASFRAGARHGRDDIGFRVARYVYGKE